MSVKLSKHKSRETLLKADYRLTDRYSDCEGKIDDYDGVLLHNKAIVRKQ